MIFPAGLLEIAEDIAGQVPTSPEYSAERNACWLVIGKAFLQLDQFGNALNSLNHLTEREAQAEFRIAAAQWSGEHSESNEARDLLRDTVDHIEFWEDEISRKDLSDLVKTVCSVLGTDAVQVMPWKLKDKFSAGNVLVTLAQQLKDPGIRRETLRSAEEFAKSVPDGNRDYALRWVVSGYTHAGLEEDEQRVRSLMSRDLELMNELEAKMFRDAEIALRPLAPPEPDSHLLKLRRFLDYGYNDVRVFFLTECSETGGLNDPEAEQLVNDPEFRRIAPPRPPSIYTDPSNFDLESLSRSLFGRPVRQRNTDRDLIDGTGYLHIADWGRFVVTLRGLFNAFGEIASRFSPEQVDQGLWYLFGEPFWLGSELRAQIPPAEIRDLVRVMYRPFHDYYLKTADQYSESGFFMWWDNLSPLAGHPDVIDTALEVLQQILLLPHPACRNAALHGLNHLFSDPRAAAIIQSYLDQNREAMSQEEIDWVELCKAGGAP
jgi:hypothetical protein